MKKEVLKRAAELSKKHTPPETLKNPFLQMAINKYARKVKEGTVDTGEELTDRDLEDLMCKDFEGCP